MASPCNYKYRNRNLKLNRGLYFYSAHKSEVAGTRLFTGAYPKQNRLAAGQIQRVSQADKLYELQQSDFKCFDYKVE